VTRRPVPGQPCSLLLVEDDRGVRESLGRALELEGFEVSSAPDGLVALEMAARDTHDAMILDVMMPRLDGLEVVRRLRADGSTIPILMLTARHEVSSRVDGLDAAIAHVNEHGSHHTDSIITEDAAAAERFMEGVDPEFLDYLHDSMGETSRQLVMEVLDSMGIECSEEEVNAVREAAASQAERFLEQSATVRRRRFVAPIMDIVELLPKEELADMAEALVNLTALKRRVSLDAETVGGPIDVAVISKGDGMIWIKRKHYFDPALNPSYFRKKT